MALTETRPETDAPLAHAGETTPSFDAFLGSGDHKTTGRLWIGAGSLVLLLSLVVSLIAAIEHIDLGASTIVDDSDRFVQLWSMGREVLLFGGVVPLLVGIATYVVPLQVGASSLAFARGAAAAFWSWLFSVALLIASYPLNGGPGGGRSDYVVLWAVALAATVMALCWAMVCIATTVLAARTPGMGLADLPVSAWGFFVFSLFGLLALPLVVAQLVLAYLDVKYGFLGDRESRLALLGVADSATLAPSLYWVGVPVLGIAAEAISVHTGRPLRFRMATMSALGLMGVASFGYDILAFASRGRAPDFHNGLLVVGLLAAVLPVLSVLALAGESLKAGTVKVRTPLIAGLLGGLLLLLGAVVGALGAIWPIVTFIETQFDTNVSLDSAFNVNDTSFHDGLRGLVMAAAVLGLVAGIHHWGHKIWGRSLDDRLGLLTTLAAAGGGVLWAIGGVASGFLEQPRLPLVASDAKGGVEALNGLSAAGTGLLAAAAALLFLNVLRTAVGGGSSNEPWRGESLEWSTASPPPLGNFASAPGLSAEGSDESAEGSESATTEGDAA